jgi:GT2 family glycosyltransferase
VTVEPQPANLAVVIPTRSRWDILRRTLAALAAQTVSGFEVVVVVDGTDQLVPDDLPATKVVTQRQAGPAAARNHGVSLTDRELILFLGDDMIPRRACVAAHHATHAARPEPAVVALGHVDWHPRVAWRPENRWLDRSGTQFDYVNMRDQAGEDVGFGRFYSCNVSLRKALFDQVGGFDEDFIFYYEDLDMGWRLGQAGMRLLYTPAARTQHLHA